MIVYDNLEHGFRIAEAVETQLNPLVDMVISRVEGDELLGGVIYQNYTRASISTHIAGFRPNWMSKDFLWNIFHYPFVQLDCNKIFCEIHSCNYKSLEFVKKLGFIEVAYIEGVFVEGDLVVMAMDRENCRWLSIEPRSVTPNRATDG